MSIFGFSTESSGGGDFLPIVKFDARSGRMFRRDRVQDASGSYVSNDEDITNTFQAIADLENLETGWINFNTGGAPGFNLAPLGQALPNRPSPDYKNGVRFMVKLGKASGGEKPIREVASTAKTFLSGVEDLYLDYQKQAPEHPGMLPVVALETTVPIKSGSGAKTSTNYKPKFKIIAWQPRGDLVFQPKGVTGAPTASPAPAQPAAVPPSTGGTIAAPPPAAAPQAAAPVTIEDDFG